MTQEYLNHLYANYIGVDQFYWTADDTAFKSIEEARAYSKKLGNPLVKVVQFGGQLADAVDADMTEKSLGNTTGEYIDDTPKVVTDDEITDAEPDVDYENMTVVALKALCVDREIELNGATKKADIIAMLVAADSAASTNNTGVVDYTTLDMEQLANICMERSIVVDEFDDAAALIVKLVAFDANL